MAVPFFAILLAAVNLISVSSFVIELCQILEFFGGFDGICKKLKNLLRGFNQCCGTEMIQNAKFDTITYT